MIRPRGPNENTIAIDVVNGGEISGSNVARSISREATAPELTRSTVNAKISPINVPVDAHHGGEQEAVPERPQIAGMIDRR